MRNFRVRRMTTAGPRSAGFFDTFDKAVTFANHQLRSSGRVVWVERHRVLGKGWEISAELMPLVQSPLEARIVRGHLPQVKDGAGRWGRVVSYDRNTHQVRVRWEGTRAGQEEAMALDQLHMV